MSDDIEARARAYAEEEVVLGCNGLGSALSNQENERLQSISVGQVKTALRVSYLDGARAEIALERKRILAALESRLTIKTSPFARSDVWQEVKKIIEGEA